MTSRNKIRGSGAQTSQPEQHIIKNAIGTINAPNAKVVYVGSHVGNPRNEEKEGGQAPSSFNGSVDFDGLDCTELKKFYSTKLCKASPLPWYPEFAWDIDEVYTELALQNSATPKFGVEELFKHAHEHFRKGESYRILIEGDAGYGKSTLMLKIVSDWSKGDSNDPTNYTSPFSLLLVVKLGSVGEDGNMSSYMGEVYKKKMALISKGRWLLEDVLESEEAEKVLILLDGYDEASAKTKEKVCGIMKKEMMSKWHVVLTSRYGHAPDHVKSNALRVTVKGFGPRQVTEAVGKFFILAGRVTKAQVMEWRVKPNDPDSSYNFDVSTLPSSDAFKNVEEIIRLPPEKKPLSLVQFKQFVWKLQAESPYKELAQCPLLCVMMCCLVSDCKNGELPSTCSGLYFAMINHNLYREARKIDGVDEDEWDLSELHNRISKDHESYLQEFGRLCFDGLRTYRMSFTFLEITGEEKKTKDNYTKVTKLIAAGVLVQDFTELNTKRNRVLRYQVPHRTTIEFLAAYYLSGEKDQSLLQQNLFDLFQLKASFDEIAVSLIEMGKARCLVDAFSVIKFPPRCLVDIPFLKNYFTQRCAADTWYEFKDALPNKLETRNLSGDVIVISSAKPSKILLQLVEQFGKEKGEDLSEDFSEDPVSLHVEIRCEKALRLSIALQTLLGSRVNLSSLEFGREFREYEIGDQTRQELTRSLQDLLKADFCPVQLSFSSSTEDLRLAVTDAMKEVPESCRLKKFELSKTWNCGDTSRLSEVLANKWLSHLEHLRMESVSGGTLNPILIRLTEPGCRLTSLHIFNYRYTWYDDLLLKDLMMLASKLETLQLENINLYFDVTRLSKYAVTETISLKRLHLVNVSLMLVGSLPSADQNQELLLAWRNVAGNLEELTIDRCEFPVELFSWLNLSVPNLRTVTIGRIHGKTSNNGKELYANQLLEALTRSNGGNIEDLSLTDGFWESTGKFPRWEIGQVLDPIQKALQHCPSMKRVNLGIVKSWEKDMLQYSSGPGPSTPSSSRDPEKTLERNIL